jgi:predicted PurR-regulated permease PerM
MKVTISVGNRTVIRVGLLILFMVIGFAAFKKAAHALTLLFIAGFLAIALNAPVHWLAQRLPGKRRGNRTVATGLAFLVVVIFLAGILSTIIPPLAKQTASFVSNLPSFIDSIHDDGSVIGRTVERYNLEPQIDKLTNELTDRLQQATGKIIDTFTMVTSSLLSILTVLVLTFMMLREGPAWIRFMLSLFDKKEQEHVRAIGSRMYKVVTGYVNGQIILAFIAAIFMLVPFLVLNINYPIALAVIVFFCGLIPLVGHTLGAIIVSIVALFTSPLAAAIVLGYYFLYQQTENIIIQPKIQASSTDMTPLMVFASVLVGVSFSGLLGGLVAIPVTACLRILALDYIERHNLIKHDPVKEIDEGPLLPHVAKAKKSRIRIKKN